MPAAPSHVTQPVLTANMIRGVFLSFCSFPPFTLKFSKTEFSMPETSEHAHCFQLAAVQCFHFVACQTTLTHELQNVF